MGFFRELKEYGMKLYTVRLAAVVGVLSTVLVAGWPVAVWLINEFMPRGILRMAVAAAVGVIVFVVPTYLRLKPQPKLGAAPPGKPRKIEQEKSSGKGALVALVGGTAALAMIGLVGPWEGKRNDPYRDIVGVWTVCYGETRVQMRRYTDAECEDMLADGLGDFAGYVLERNPNLRHRPYQLAAATSLTYNIGPAAYRRSTVAKRFSAGDYRGACDAFLMWNRAGGRVVQGLVNRRHAERRVCLTDLPR